MKRHPKRSDQDSAKTCVATSSYPSLPWHLNGQQWAALFRTDQPVNTRSAESMGARPIFRHRLGIALLRYLEGDLCYDEFFVGIPVWIGWKPHLWIRDIWVSDEGSKAAGIHEWNLPKQMASFDWTDRDVTIEDQHGLVAKLGTPPLRTHLPVGFAILPIAGNQDGQWRTALATWSGKFSYCQPTVCDWSDRFDEGLLGRGWAFSSPNMRMKVRGPKKARTERTQS